MTHDPEVAARARLVFRPWQVPATVDVAASFEISPSEHDEDGRLGWRVWSSRSSETSRYASADGAIRAIELEAIHAFVPLLDGTIALHGALVEIGGHAAVILGPPGSGKSSLACALWRDGAVLLSDDVALVDFTTAEARPAPRRVALRDTSRALLGDALWKLVTASPSTSSTDEGLCFLPEDVDGRVPPRTTTIAAVVFLGRPSSGTRAPTLTRVEPARAVLDWLPYVVAQRRIEPEEAIRRVVPLALRVSAWHLDRGPLDDMAALVRHTLAVEV